MLRLIRRTFSLLCLVMVAGLLLSACQPAESKKLTEEEVRQLRVEYPVFDPGKGLDSSIGNVDLKEFTSEAPGYVYAEVLEPIAPYERPWSPGVPDIDQMLEEEGEATADYFGYKIKVLEDYKDHYAKGSILRLEANVMFQEAIAELKTGSHILVPIGPFSEHVPEDVVGFNHRTLYYVTDQDYVLASFSDQDEYSGLSLKDAVQASMN